MKAIVQDEYGSADVLRLEDVETPVAGRARSRPCRGGGRVHRRLARHDRHAVRDPPRFRAAAPKSASGGRTSRGCVEAVGERVTAFRPGDEVFGVGNGRLRRVRVAPERTSSRRSRRTSRFEQAAAVPISG